MATTKATTLAHTLGGIAGSIETAEINRLDGVTGDIQTQLDAKAPKASPTFTGTITAPNDSISGDVISGGTIGAGTWNGGIIGSAYGGNLVKTGSQTWNGSENSKYINGCFSATYKSYLVTGAFWNSATNGHALYMKLTNATDNAISNSYEYGFRGVNMDGTEYTRSGSNAGYIQLDGAISNGAGKTNVFQFIVKGTHDTDMETSFMGHMLEESNFLSGGGFNTAESTVMVGLYFEREASTNIEGWVNVYGIQE